MRLKKENKLKTSSVTFRLTEEEANYLQTKANLYCEGNASEWARYAALNFVPNKDDLDIEKKK